MANYPFSLDDDASLFVAVNNKRTSLTSNISISDLTIPVVSTSGFPNSGFITILSDPNDILKSEAIRYEGLTLTTFSGVERGAGGTTAFAHVANDNVDLTIVADHHNELKDAVIALESLIGISGSENFPRFDHTGSVIIPGTIYGNTLVISSTASVGTDLIVSGTLTTPTGIVSQSLTVSGIPVSLGDHFTLPDEIILSSGTFTKHLTVSGQPVSTGTVDTATLDALYVNESGDTMTGDLFMSQNRIREAGVAEVSASAPTPAEGMIWYNTTSGTTFIRITDWEPISRFPYRSNASFTTANVPNSGGSVEEDQSFNNRSLVNKIRITPGNGSVDSVLVEIYKRDTFLEDDLEYKATTSGFYVDNDVWYHEDLDLTSELHIRITNNSLVDSTFDVELFSEVFA